jgi:hypothetical protein
MHEPGDPAQSHPSRNFLTQSKRESRFIPIFGYSATSEEILPNMTPLAARENSDPKAAVERLPQI